MKMFGLSFQVVVLSMLCQGASGGFTLDSSERRVVASAGNMDGGATDVQESFDPGVFDRTAMVSVSAGFAIATITSNIDVLGMEFSAAGSSSAGAIGMFSGAGANVSFTVLFTLDSPRTYDFGGSVMRNAFFPGSSPFVRLVGPGGVVFNLLDLPGGGATSLAGEFVLVPGQYTLSAAANASDSGVGVPSSGSFDFSLTLVPAPGTACLFGVMGACFTSRRRS